MGLAEGRSGRKLSRGSSARGEGRGRREYGMARWAAGGEGEGEGRQKRDNGTRFACHLIPRRLRQHDKAGGA